MSPSLLVTGNGTGGCLRQKPSPLLFLVPLKYAQLLQLFILSPFQSLCAILNDQVTAAPLQSSIALLHTALALCVYAACKLLRESNCQVEMRHTTHAKCLAFWIWLSCHELNYNGAFTVWLPRDTRNSHFYEKTFTMCDSSANYTIIKGRALESPRISTPRSSGSSGDTLIQRPFPVAVRYTSIVT